MEFEYDLAKSRSNAQKHGIDFEQAQALWDDENAVEKETEYPSEERIIRIGSIGGRIWAAVYTRREDRIRLISVRRARDDESELYRGG